MSKYLDYEGLKHYNDKLNAELATLETKLNENIIKNPEKTYLVWKGNQFPNTPRKTESGQLLYSYFKAPAGSTIDWGDGNVQTFETADKEITRYEYTDGVEYHLITITGLTSIPDGAFNYCTALVGISLANTITSIGSYALSDVGIASIFIPSSVTYLSQDALSHNEELVKVTIEGSVVIETQALNDCKKLQKVYILSHVPSKESIGLASVPKIIVPKGAADIYKNNIIWSKYADKIVYEIDSSDLDKAITDLDKDNIAYLNKENLFTARQMWIKAKNPYLMLGFNSSLQSTLGESVLDFSYYNNGEETTTDYHRDYIYHSYNNYNTDEYTEAKLGFPTKSGTIALIEDIKALNIENAGKDSIILKYSGTVDETHFSNTNTGESAVVFGEANNNTANRVLIAGKLNTNSGSNVIQSGLKNTNNANHNIQVGESLTNKAPHSAQFGVGNSNEGQASIQGGNGNTNSGAGVIQGGNGNTNSGSNLIQVGYNNSNTVNYALQLGNGNKILSGIGAVQFGQLNTTGGTAENEGALSLTQGANNINEGYCSLICGEQNTILSTNRSWIGGALSRTNADITFVHGYNCKAGYYAQKVFGYYNDNKANTLLEIGNGKKDARSNAFEVLKDGRAKVFTAPRENNDVVRKAELDTKLDKVTTASTYSRLYGIASNGEQIIRNISAAVEASTIPIRDAQGRLTAADGDGVTNVATVGQLNKKYDKAGGTIGGNVIITGDLTVNGTEHINNTENLAVKNAMIYSNSHGATLAQLGGLGIKTNSTDIYGIVYDPTSDSVKLGLGKSDADGKFTFNANEGEPVAVRDDSSKLTNDHIIKWDSANHKLVDGGKSVSDIEGQITAETKTRKDTDDSLQSQITKEISDRQSADSTLQVNIASEASTRKAADDALTAKFDDYVTLATAQTISGAKTFSAKLKASGTPTENNDVLRYQDIAIEVESALLGA